MYYDRAEGLLLPSIEDALTKTRFKEAGLILLGYLLARMAGTFDLQLEPDEMQVSYANLLDAAVPSSWL